jgi:hypothetical protein
MATDDFERSISYGEAALSYLKGNQSPAYPRNYELWYTYAGGFNRELNKAINEYLKRVGRVTPEMTERFYEEFLSPVRLGDRVATIIGVLQPSVPYPSETEIIANVVTSPHHLDATMVDGRVHRMTELFGRLAPGVDVEAARTQLRAAHGAIKQEYPEAYPASADFRVNAVSLRDQITAPARTVLLVLLAAAVAHLAHATQTGFAHELVGGVGIAGMGQKAHPLAVLADKRGDVGGVQRAGFGAGIDPGADTRQPQLRHQRNKIVAVGPQTM